MILHAETGRAIMTSQVQHRSWISRMRRSAVGTALTCVAVLVPFVVLTRLARAQSYTLLYSFKSTGGDGTQPQAGLILDPPGNLYGTTSQGGSSGAGTVFMLDNTGKETVLYSFSGSDGFYPNASLLRDTAGNLYSTTYGGGSSGNGVVFRLNTDGTETVLHSFAGYPKDGANPWAALIQDSAGNLYSTTELGGAHQLGTVFKLTKTGKETILHSFKGNAHDDGGKPEAGLILDKEGNLYGTTYMGNGNRSHGRGTVFKLERNGTATVLHSFTGGTDGEYPVAGLIRDTAGNLYGTTLAGGDTNCYSSYGCGTVFQMDTSGVEVVLYRFGDGGDGAFPHASLIRDAEGNLYGTAYEGGNGGCDDHLGCGVVFKFDKNGTETVLHIFTGTNGDGVYPAGDLVRDASGNLYGTTYWGGDLSCNPPDGCGTVWKLTP